MRYQYGQVAAVKRQPTFSWGRYFCAVTKSIWKKHPIPISLPHYICQKWLHVLWCLCLGVSDPGNWKGICRVCEEWVMRAPCTPHTLRARLIPACPLNWARLLSVFHPNGVQCALMGAPQWELKVPSMRMTNRFISKLQ